jgi:hypothetical protein
MPRSHDRPATVVLQCRAVPFITHHTDAVPAFRVLLEHPDQRLVVQILRTRGRRPPDLLKERAALRRVPKIHHAVVVIGGIAVMDHPQPGPLGQCLTQVALHVHDQGIRIQPEDLSVLPVPQHLQEQGDFVPAGMALRLLRSDAAEIIHPVRAGVGFVALARQFHQRNVLRGGTLNQDRVVTRGNSRWSGRW